MEATAKKFQLGHTARYAKLSYKHSDDIWADIMACLRADDYTPSTHAEVLGIIANNVTPLIKDDIRKYTFDFMEATNPLTCWTNGYLTSDYIPLPLKKGDKDLSTDKKYDYQEAVLRFFLRKLTLTNGVDLGELPEASFKVLPLSDEAEKNRKKHKKK